jgi:hypothetical protein
MSGINVGRWLAGGVVAGIIILLVEGIASFTYMGDMETTLEAHGMSLEMSAAAWVLSVAVSLIAGLTLIFFYAAARPRFGPGPKTAVIVAVAMWFGGYLASLIGYHMIGLYPMTMLALWGLVGIIELIVAALAGGRIYQEREAT